MRSFIGAAALAIGLAGCGGGDGSSTPSPSPSPSPTPSPTPTPTPTPSYTAFDDLTGDQRFEAGCAYFQGRGTTLSSGRAAGTRVGDSNDPSPLRFQESGEIWTLDFNAPVPSLPDLDQSFGPTDLITEPTIPNTSEYRKANTNGGTDTFILTSGTVFGTTFDYLRGGSFNGSANDGSLLGLSCSFGVPTIADDRPSGSADYSQVEVIGMGVTVDPSTGAITGEFDLRDSTATFATDRSSGNFDPIVTTLEIRGQAIGANGLTGPVIEFGSFADGTSDVFSGNDDGTDQTGEYLGTFDTSSAETAFSGWFFGPEAVEAGYSFSIQFSGSVGGGADQTILLVGQVFAKK